MPDDPRRAQVIRASTPEERYEEDLLQLRGVRDAPEAEQPFLQRLHRQVYGTPSPPPPVLRAPTWSERINGYTQDAYDALASTLPGYLTAPVRASLGSDPATPPPFGEVMGEAVMLPGPRAAAGLAKAVRAGKAATGRAAAVRAVSQPRVSRAPAIIDPSAPTPTTVSLPPGVAPSIITGRKGPIGGPNAKPLVDLIVPTDTPGRYRLKDAVLDRMEQIYLLGNAAPRISNWRGIKDPEILDAFAREQDAARVWARMWGATSANTSVPRNAQESVAAFRQWLQRPEAPFTEENTRALGITQAGSKYGNLNNAIYPEGVRGQPDIYDLSGSGKVHAMGEFMLGKPRAPIDVHVLHAVGSNVEKFDPQRPALRQLMQGLEGRALRDEDIYFRFERALSDALQEIAPGHDFNQVFGEFWEGARASKGLKFQGGPIDLMRSVGLLDYGKMLDPAALAQALRHKSWTPAAIAGLFSAMGIGGAGTAGPPPPPPAYEGAQ